MASQVEVLRDDKQYKLYRTSCECLNPDDSITIDIEVDDNTVVLELYYDTKELTTAWGVTNPISRLFETAMNRIKVACRILFTGHVKTTGGFIFRGEKHIDEFCDTIQKAKNDMKESLNE